MPLPQVTLIGRISSTIASRDEHFANFRLTTLEAGGRLPQLSTSINVRARGALVQAALSLKPDIHLIVIGDLVARQVEHPEHGLQTYYEVEARALGVCLA